MSESRTTPKHGAPKRVPTDIDLKLISSVALWEEAERFYNFILDNHLSYCVRTLPGDVRWAIFFALVTRYIIENQQRLGVLVVSSDDDIPF